jgi:hypothetical protein
MPKKHIDVLGPDSMAEIGRSQGLEALDQVSRDILQLLATLPSDRILAFG